MVHLKNSNAKLCYNYIRYHVNEISKEIIIDIVNNYTSTRINKRKHNDANRHYYNGVKCDSKLVGKSNKYGKCFLDIPMSFDIETNTIQEDKKSFMYIWQFGLCNNVIIGSNWFEFIHLLDLLRQTIKPRKNQRIICFIANLGYEFQFMRKWLNITDSFLKEQRKPCYIEHDNWLVFQDALLMTNSNLARLAKDYTNTQKCVGDLDYNIIHSFDTLTDTELTYCDNDVLILTEWATYYYDTYIKEGYKPLTITGVLEKAIKQAYEQSGCSIENTKPVNEQEYNFIMSWVYRGGYTHANELYVGVYFNNPLKDNIFSFDFTSSYPSIMTLQKCFPTIWQPVNNPTINKMIMLGKDYCTCATYTFYDLKATTNQTIESKHKCLELVNPIFDNGRIRSGSKCTVALTNLDLDSYLDFYTWSKCEVVNAQYSERKYLEAYLVKEMLEKYVAKDVLKKLGQPYAKEKALCNSAYGLTVKRLNDVITHYSEGEWTEESAKSYDEQMKTKPFSPWVGVYISAMARRNLLQTVKQLETINTPVLYCDTDSIKILHHNEQSQSIIDNYNKHIESLIDLACIRYNVEKQYISDLGMFDQEHTEGITRFKCLGAKRYLISFIEHGEEKHEQTIAGLPKNILFKQYEPNTAYEVFENDMTIKECKLTSCYNDEDTTVWIDNEPHTELSSIALVKSDFQMKIDTVWLNAFLEYQRTLNRERNR